jgi:hypothetical protein
MLVLHRDAPACSLGRQGITDALTDQPPLALRAGDDDIRRHFPGRRAGVEVGEVQRPALAASPLQTIDRQLSRDQQLSRGLGLDL